MAEKCGKGTYLLPGRGIEIYIPTIIGDETEDDPDGDFGEIDEQEWPLVDFFIITRPKKGERGRV